MRPKFVAFLGALVLACSLLAGPAVAAKRGGTESATKTSTLEVQAKKKPWKPKTGGFFNDPWGARASKFRIEKQIVQAIKHARKGSYIRIAVYSFDRVNVAKALIAAHKRGVRVQVLHNDHAYTKAMKMLKKRLGTNKSKKSWDYTCKTGCRSVQGVLHNKIYLFEHTGGARNVVMTGSANLTKNGAVHQFNDLYVKTEVPKLYGVLLDLFKEMKKDKTAKPLYKHIVYPGFQLWVMPRPRNNSKVDPIMQILRPVKCKGANNGTGVNGRTKIRVSMHSWNGERGTYIARRLRKLYAQGCNVKVMWGMGGARMKQVIGMKTPRGRVPRRSNSYDTNCDPLREVDMYSHQKYMTISGHYGKNRSASYVYTGSSNWTPSGVSGDEMILRIQGPNLVKRWNKNFEFIWTKRSRVVGGPGGWVPNIPPCPTTTAPDSARRAPGADASEDTHTPLRFSGDAWEND